MTNALIMGVKNSTRHFILTIQFQNDFAQLIFQVIQN